MTDPGHIAPLFTALRMRQDWTQAQLSVDHTLKLRRVPSIVRSMDEDWVMEYVAQASGFAINSILAAKKNPETWLGSSSRRTCS